MSPKGSQKSIVHYIIVPRNVPEDEEFVMIDIGQDYAFRIVDVLKDSCGCLKLIVDVIAIAFSNPGNKGGRNGRKRKKTGYVVCKLTLDDSKIVSSSQQKIEVIDGNILPVAFSDKVLFRVSWP